MNTKTYLTLMALFMTVSAIAFQCGAAPTQVAAPAGGGDGPKMIVTDAWSRPSPMEAGNGVVYLKLMNEGNQADALLSVKSDVAEAVELHETKMDANDVMRMSPVSRIDVPAGGSVSLEPGGKHIMLINLKQPLTSGQKITVTLNFENSGPITVEAEVRPDQSSMDNMDQNMVGQDQQ